MNGNYLNLTALQTWRGGRILKGLLACLFAFACMPGYSQEKPDAPVNLKCDKLEGSLVSLSWERAGEGKTLLYEDFEGEEFAPGWTFERTNTSFYAASWFHFPTSDFVDMGEEVWRPLVYEGDKSAVVFFDSFFAGESQVQNETFITPEVDLPAAGAYLEFYCYIDPHILEYGAYEEFPDHYYVKASYDNGKNWEILWDARYNSAPDNAWQKVVLALGPSPSGKVKVAFQSMGEQDAELNLAQNFAWAIDNVKIMEATPAAPAAAPLLMKTSTPKASLTYREFTPKNPLPAVKKAVRRLVKSAAQIKAESAALVNSYKVYLGDELLVEGLTRLTYTDLSEKSPGKHTYKVTAYSAATQAESDPAVLEVDIPEFTTFPPQNFKVSSQPEEGGKTYTVTITWDAPQGSRVPKYYKLYSNGLFFAMMQPEDGRVIEQTMVGRGIREYAIEAEYENPAGVSERIVQPIALGTRFNVASLSGEVKGEDVVLAWEAPAPSEFEVASYNVYRGNEEISTGLAALTYTDANAPKGKYEYSVKAVYKDGFVSLPRSLIVYNGVVPAVDMPFAEDFSGGLTPGNWVVDIMSQMNPSYQWKFDNFYDLPIQGGGFEGEFASINTSSAALTSVKCALTTPPIKNTKSVDKGVFVSFDLDFQSGTDAEGKLKSDGKLEISTNLGLSWEELEVLPSYKPEDLKEGETCKPSVCTIDLSKRVEGAETFMLRWVYSSFRDKHLAIDNVKVHEGTSTAIEKAVADDAIAIVAGGNAIFVKSAGGDIKEAAVYSLAGACVAKVASPGSEASFSVSGPAVYMVKVMTAEGTKVQKVIVK